MIGWIKLFSPMGQELFDTISIDVTAFDISSSEYRQWFRINE